MLSIDSDERKTGPMHGTKFDRSLGKLICCKHLMPVSAFLASQVEHFKHIVKENVTGYFKNCKSNTAQGLFLLIKKKKKTF